MPSPVFSTAAGFGITVMGLKTGGTFMFGGGICGCCWAIRAVAIENTITDARITMGTLLAGNQLDHRVMCEP